MRIIIQVSSVFLFLFTSGSLFAQIPNAGFEQWSAGNPDEWFSSNLPGFWTPVTQTSPGNSGESAVRGAVVTSSFGDTVLPLLVSGQFGAGFPVPEKYSALTGYFKFVKLGEDILYITTLMYKGESYLGGGIIFISDPHGSYTPFSVPITYNSNEVPDTCVIQIAISNSGGGSQPGSSFVIDDLGFTGTTQIENRVHTGQHQTFALLQNYPNPFNPTTAIEFTIPEPEFVELKVFNMLGKEMATIISKHMNRGNYSISFDGTHLPSGTYTYQLVTGKFKAVRRMILLK